MKKAAVVTAVLLAAGFLTGCQKEEIQEAIAPLVAEAQDKNQTEDTQKADANPVIPEIDTSVSIQPGAKIAVVSKNTKGEFWKTVQKGMQQAVADVNAAYGFSKDDQISMTFEGPADEQDVAGQINTLDAVIAENPNALCLSASDMDSCQAQLEAARENGIPVVAFDSNVNDAKLVRAFRATDNKRVGEIGAYRLAVSIGKMGKVAVFSAQEKTQSVQERVEGFTSYIAKYSDIEVVEIVYADQVEDMTAAMQEVLERYPKLDGVFCTNADISELYLNMKKDENREPVAMVGVDATERQQKAVKDAEEVGVVSQQPYAMGYQTMYAAILATAPQKSVSIEKTAFIEPAWIDAANLENPSYSDYIY